MSDNVGSSNGIANAINFVQFLSQYCYKKSLFIFFKLICDS